MKFETEKAYPVLDRTPAVLSALFQALMNNGSSVMKDLKLFLRLMWLVT